MRGSKHVLGLPGLAPATRTGLRTRRSDSRRQRHEDFVSCVLPRRVIPDHNTSYPWHGDGRARRPFQKNCLSQYKARQAPVRSGLMSPPYSYQRALRLTLMAVVLLAAPSASFWGADAEDEVPATVSASGPPASGDAYPVREEGRQAVEWVGKDLSGQVVEDSQTVTG